MFPPNQTSIRRQWFLALALLAGVAGVAPAQGVAKVKVVDGALLQREAPGKPWQPLKAGSDVVPGRLLIALPGADFISQNGAVGVKMLADLGKRGPLPVFESGVVFNDNLKADLDITLDRGIVGFANLKAKGEAKIKVRVAGKTWDFVLHEPMTTVGIEIYGRHPPATPSLTFAKGGQVQCKDHPTIEVVVLTLQGHATVTAGGREHQMQAPPGPAILQWDSIADRYHVGWLEKRPEPILPTGEEEMKLYKMVCARAKRLEAEPINKVLEEFRTSKDPNERKAAAVVYAALDDIPGLLKTLNDPTHADLRDHAVTVLRNFIGRCHGTVESLADVLVTQEKYTPVQAKGLVHLLYGVTDQQREQPETYEVLIKLLEHSKLPVRELARWHLIRLVPAGKKIDFDAGGPPEQREKAVAQWRALIPEGQLPPRPEVKKGKE